jgi:hypothetical protein
VPDRDRKSLDALMQRRVWPVDKSGEAKISPLVVWQTLVVQQKERQEGEAHESSSDEKLMNSDAGYLMPDT